MGDIVKGLSESVKGEMAASKSTLEVMILNEVREREAKDEELLHHMEKDKVQIRDDLDQKYKLQEQQRAGRHFSWATFSVCFRYWVWVHAIHSCVGLTDFQTLESNYCWALLERKSGLEFGIIIY